MSRHSQHFNGPREPRPQVQEASSNLPFSLTLLPLLLYFGIWFFVGEKVLSAPIDFSWLNNFISELKTPNISVKDGIVVLAVMLVFLDLKPALRSTQGSAHRIVKKGFSFIVHLAILWLPPVTVDACLINLTMLTLLVVLLSIYINMMMARLSFPRY